MFLWSPQCYLYCCLSQDSCLYKPIPLASLNSVGRSTFSLVQHIPRIPNSTTFQKTSSLPLPWPPQPEEKEGPCCDWCKAKRWRSLKHFVCLSQLTEHRLGSINPQPIDKDNCDYLTWWWRCSDYTPNPHPFKQLQKNDVLLTSLLGGISEKRQCVAWWAGWVGDFLVLCLKGTLLLIPSFSSHIFFFRMREEGKHVVDNFKTNESILVITLIEK